MAHNQEQVPNAADREQVKKAGQRERFGRERDLDDVVFILSTKQGRRFFWRYIEMCGVFKTSFTGSSETFFKEGERNVGLKLLGDLNEASPESYLLMMKEAKENSNV